MTELIAIVRDESDARLPPEARSAMMLVAGQLEDLQRRIRDLSEPFIAGIGRMKQAAA